MRILPSIAALLATALSTASALDVTVMSFNIRQANPGDGNNVWSNRKELAAETIANSGAEIAGLQEAFASQLADLKHDLPGYDTIGVGREDGREAGEHCAILYDATKFVVKSSGTFWLSEKPEEPGSMSWGTACTRIATWGIFQPKDGGDRFLVLNTHLDHRSEKAREEGAKLIAARLRELAAGMPVVVTGDFNTTRETTPLRALTAPGALSHAREQAELRPAATFNGFGTESDGSEIDHILISPGIEVTGFEILVVKKGGVFVSDHWPIIARLRIPE